MEIRIAAVQYSTDLHDKTANIEKSLELLDEAAHTADLVLLPETSFTGYWLGKDMEQFAEPVPGPMTALVSEIAVTRSTDVCFSLAEKDGDKMYNTAVLVGAAGNLIGKHRKVHLFEADIEAGVTPGDDLEVLDTHLGKIGMLVCYDAHHIESARVLDLRGADIVLIPSVGLIIPPETFESTMHSWETVLRANAKYGRSHVVWANKTGKDGDLTAIGNSMILDPRGHIIARGGIEEEIVRATVNIRRKFPRPGRRPELYAPIARP